MQANQANVTFNTHKAVKALKGSGFNEKQAEAVVETIDKAVNETVATKADLALLGADLKVQGAKIEALRETVEGVKENIAKNVATKADLKAQGIDIANLETRIMRMMWLQLMVMVSMFVTVVVTLL